ncbi:MAG: hypothetical protein OXC15_17570 [Rhodospirillaceae bacterium]|nr:hypothetical protein [Rhodospirillaceae bacterium]
MLRLAKRSKQHLLAALALVLSLSLAGGVAAQTDEDTAEPQDVEESNADAAVDWDADAKVRQMMAEWKATDPVAQHLLARDDVSVVEGVASASLNTQEKRWSKARSLAYVKAFVSAMNDYVSRVRTRHTNRLVRNQFQEDLDESDLVYRAGESADDMVSRVATKAIALGERKLDTALEESGMSPEEIERLTPPQKRVAFSDRLLLEATTEAVGSAHGLVPIKTFEALDDEGGSAIAVVAVRSPRMKNLAEQIAAGKAMRPDADRARASIFDQVGELSDRDLAYEFGPRVWWDEHGYPTVIAFGQWAWSPEGLDKRKKARHRGFAIEQAESDALSHLAMFVNVATRFSRESVRGEEAEEFHRVWQDGTVSDEETARIADRLIRNARTNSAVALTGLEVRREWFGRHPDVEGHELVGVIVSWSPAQEDKIRAELGQKPKHKPAEKKVRKSSVSSGTADSRDLMDPADF